MISRTSEASASLGRPRRRLIVHRPAPDDGKNCPAGLCAAAPRGAEAMNTLSKHRQSHPLPSKTRSILGLAHGSSPRTVPEYLSAQTKPRARGPSEISLFGPAAVPEGRFVLTVPSSPAYRVRAA